MYVRVWATTQPPAHSPPRVVGKLALPCRHTCVYGYVPCTCLCTHVRTHTHVRACMRAVCVTCMRGACARARARVGMRVCGLCVRAASTHPQVCLVLLLLLCVCVTVLRHGCTELPHQVPQRSDLYMLPHSTHTHVHVHGRSHTGGCTHPQAVAHRRSPTGGHTQAVARTHKTVTHTPRQRNNKRRTHW